MSPENPDVTLMCGGCEKKDSERASEEQDESMSGEVHWFLTFCGFPSIFRKPIAFSLSLHTHASMFTRFRLLLIAAILVGLLIGWIDTSPRWDDTGITVGLIFLVSAVFGAVMPSRAWVWGLAVGSGIPVWNIVLHGNFAALV
jgi:hypothetical protein